MDMTHSYTQGKPNNCISALLVVTTVIVVGETLVCFWRVVAPEKSACTTTKIFNIETAALYNALIIRVDTALVNNHLLVVLGAVIICQKKYVYAYIRPFFCNVVVFFEQKCQF